MIKFQNLSLRRGPRILFENVNFDLNNSDSVGLVGENGSGKTSLLSLLLGEISSDEGEAKIPRGTRISHAAQETPSTTQSALDFVLDGDEEFRTVEKNLRDSDAQSGKAIALLHARMEEIDGYSAPARAARILSGLGFHSNEMEQQTRSFSGGWRVRLNLAQALMRPSDLLLLDEPTNHLDLDTIVWLEDWLKKYPGTLIIISHDRDFIDACCNRIMHIENLGIRLYPGNYSQFERQRAERMALEQALYEKQQKQIMHMESFIRQFRYKASKARQAQSRVKTLEKMQLILPAHINSPFRFSFKSCDRLSDPILKLDGVDAGYDGKTVLHKISLFIGSGDRIGLLGANGAGKSTLIKVMAEELELLGGFRTTSQHLKIGYFAQHQMEQLRPDLTPMQHFLREYPESTTQQIRSYLGGYNFQGERVDEKVDHFSGGEKARLALAIIIYSAPNLLLLDEPTNHLDMEMRHALSVAMQEYEGAMILVSHDRSLVNRVTDKLWLIRNGLLSEFNEDMQAYLRLLRQANKERLDQLNPKPRESTDARMSKKERRQHTAQLRQQLKPKRDEIRQLEQEIHSLQNDVENLEAILNNPETYETESTASLSDMMQKKSGMESRIRTAEDLWYAVTEELEALEKALE